MCHLFGCLCPTYKTLLLVSSNLLLKAILSVTNVSKNVSKPAINVLCAENKLIKKILDLISLLKLSLMILKSSVLSKTVLGVYVFYNFRDPIANSKSITISNVQPKMHKKNQVNPIWKRKSSILTNSKTKKLNKKLIKT